VLGVRASFWNTLEQHYRTALAREAERDRLAQHLEWLKQMPVKVLTKEGWLPSFSDPVDQLDALLRFFGVASPEAWQEVWSDLKAQVAYRKARTFESDFFTVTAWLRYGEVLAHAVETEPYDAKKFRETLHEVRQLTFDRTTDFVDVLIQMCAASGVAVCFVPELPKLRLCGATRWLTPEKALIQLSLRYKTNDHLWFTFFHEAGHILLHGKRTIFVEEKSSTTAANRASGQTSTLLENEEDEANRFAQDALVPGKSYEAFVAGADFSAYALREFAEAIGIDAAIVLGRLQHDGYVPYRTPLNRIFKRSYGFTSSE
jgi:HTH-type transcriptional regulator / antitoxin HigA